MKIAIVGCGKIGRAFASSLLESSLTSPSELLGFDTNPLSRNTGNKDLGISISGAPSPGLSEAEVVILSVKPQDFGAASAQYAPFFEPHQLIISVMAGITLSRLAKSLPGMTQLVRSMPNLPIQIRRSVTPFVCAESISEKCRTTAFQIFSACGVGLPLREEWQIDAATAVSGSGPAYLFRVAETLIAAAVKLGFSRAEAEVLVSRTFEGSTALWLSHPTSLTALKESVISRGGTTEAAFQVFDSRKLDEIFTEGVQQAFERSKALSKS